MRTGLALAAALTLAGCGGARGPDGPVDANAGMMISDETVMSDALGNEANAAPADPPD